MMKYYKDKNSEIYAYEENVSKEFLTQKIKELGLTPLTKKELEELNKPKETTLEYLRLAKLNELGNWASLMAEKSRIDLKGFGVIDGGYKYLLNVRAMKNNFEALPQKLFRMFDNSFKEVSLKDLEKIEKAVELGGITLHSLKWKYETAISKAKSKEELEAISFSQTIEIDLDKEVNDK
jgi:3-deoxy-D-arabino-heptulosonate 7-phosphate synthase